MMNEYRFNPNDYTNAACLSDDMDKFYKQLERYLSTKSDIEYARLECYWGDLFLTIKQRQYDGSLPLYLANDMRTYFRELII
jgi:hypothetical protein